MKITLEYEPGEDHVWALRAALAAIEEHGKPEGPIPVNLIEYTLMGGEVKRYAVKWNKASVSVWRQGCKT